MTLKPLKPESTQDAAELHPYLIIVDESSLAIQPLPSGQNESQFMEARYTIRLEQMKAFHSRLKEWISIKGIEQQVKSLEVPTAPVGSLVTLCTPASALMIQDMPGVKTVILEV